MKTVVHAFGILDRWIDRVCGAFLVASVFLMIFLTLFTIAMRFVGAGFLWIDPLVRHLVFFSAFLGGTLATGRQSHIGIDLLSKVLEANNLHHAKAWVVAVTSLVCAAAVVWLAMASYELAHIELEFDNMSELEVQTGYLIMCIPLGLSLIAYRFFYLFLKLSFLPPETANKEMN